MKQINYKITLLSDAEPGSGLGNEIVNDVIARNHNGIPVIRGAHLKGLLRQQLADIGQERSWSMPLAVLCFGRAGENGDDGIEGRVRVSDAVAASENSSVRTITRTCLNEAGTVKSGSLRTTEAIAAGTEYIGQLMIAEDAPETVEMALRLALLSLAAVGGGRTRGSGACCVSIDGETVLPGELLRKLHTLADSLHSVDAAPSAVMAVEKEPEGSPILLRLIFEAQDPVCCPDTPVTAGNNVIQSGLGIPASAVQGLVITRLNREDVALATATYTDRRTRAWPLLPLPAGVITDAEDPLPVRVALSHRMSKLPNELGTHEFKDVAIEPYDWRTVASGSPLKGSDGVLYRTNGEQGSILWKSGDMPRVLTSHSVHFNPGKDDAGKPRKRNLFTVESQAPMTFCGLISLPARAAELFKQSVAKDNHVSFGKSRTVRGGGTLHVESVHVDRLFAEWQKEPVFVLQSPAVMPETADATGKSAEVLLGELVAMSGWGELAVRERKAGEIMVATQAACAVRFGWNRHSGKSGVSQTNRLQARKVFLPGTVFVLKEKPQDLEKLLVRGLGVDLGDDVDGRVQGYGAVLPHPGVASISYRPTPNYEKLKSKDEAGQIALSWFESAKRSGLSPSQVAAVAERIKGESSSLAADFLRRQKLNRASRIWERWKPIFDDVLTRVQNEPQQTKKALRTLQDILIANRNDGSEKERSK